MFNDAVMLYNTRQFTESYHIFSGLLSASRTPELLFNLALCCKFAEIPASSLKCVELLEEAAGMIKHSPVIGKEKDPIYDALADLNKDNAAYLMPMDVNAVKRDSKHALDKILRVAIDVYARMGEAEKVRQLAGRLKGKDYANVRVALELVGETL